MDLEEQYQIDKKQYQQEQIKKNIIYYKEQKRRLKNDRKNFKKDYIKDVQRYDRNESQRNHNYSSFYRKIAKDQQKKYQIHKKNIFRKEGAKNRMLDNYVSKNIEKEARKHQQDYSEKDSKVDKRHNYNLEYQ